MKKPRPGDMSERISASTLELYSFRRQHFQTTPSQGRLNGFPPPEKGVGPWGWFYNRLQEPGIRASKGPRAHHGSSLSVVGSWLPGITRPH